MKDEEKFKAQYWGQCVLHQKSQGHEATPFNDGYIVSHTTIRWHDTYLLLKPLSSISDEDALVCASIIHSDQSLIDEIYDLLKGNQIDKRPFDLDEIKRYKYDSDEDGDYYHIDVLTIGKIVSTVRIYDDGDIYCYDENGNSFDDSIITPTRLLQAYDFLRSKEYALPWKGISVEEQIEKGWIKLREK